jgi:hypothetical protein
MADPFAGTNTRNLLQHMVVPRIVPDGTTYQVKNDLLVSGDLVVGGSVSAQTTNNSLDNLTVNNTTTTAYLNVEAGLTVGPTTGGVIEIPAVNTTDIRVFGTAYNMGTGTGVIYTNPNLRLNKYSMIFVQFTETLDVNVANWTLYAKRDITDTSGQTMIVNTYYRPVSGTRISYFIVQQAPP